jgi:hypothetical protein
LLERPGPHPDLLSPLLQIIHLMMSARAGAPMVLSFRIQLAHAFSLYAAVRCNAHQRKEFERMCRYITRPAIGNARL